MAHTQGLWKSACDQIRHRSIAPDYYGTRRRVFKTDMLIIPFCLESKHENRLALPEPDEVLEEAEEVWTKLRPAPDWSSLWTLCESHAGSVVSSGGEAEALFPGVLIFTNSRGPL